ncbi:hypothetical protein CB0940_08433 [Cercospora beticola]|uniref:2'-5' RNA ligase family protein n=1 Tax=Cercospora beticola TaxID=122368 RepID=A0A2G5HP83_CERBT|nr:hypothetical protein CB0940_08433 [Cercospora beticola]PIA94318.1 hypothetical protein CB0940_08433 [Cercospora beticola]WPB05010.1 hypothetical protein RHO25_009658 [Cercospora beticola]
MSSTGGLSYSATLSQGLPATSKQFSSASSQAQQAPSNDQSSAQRSRGQQASHIDRANHSQPEAHRKRRPSPSHIPQTGNEEQNVYVLTLLTDKPLHERMTDLRKRYFPKKINKLAAHLTLFHALPESKLESKIIHTLLEVTKTTSPFRVEATEPFRLKKGFAISVSNQHGGNQAKSIHRQLQQAWKGEGWLSQQDAGGCRVHYTLMNKVDDEGEVQNALDELKSFWKGDGGKAEGLALWRYDRGFWRWERKFSFKGESGS